MTADFRLYGGGSVYLLWADSRRARKWAAEYLPGDALKYAGATAIEPRYVGDILAGIAADGLSIAGVR